MIVELSIAFCLVALTVTIHASGLGMVLSHVLHSKVGPEDTPFLAHYVSTDSHRLAAD
jgi:hypothetical protein